MKVALVDGFATSSPLVQELRRYGVDCGHVRSGQAPSAANPNDYDFEIPYGPDEEEIVARLSEHGVSRVVPGLETGVILANALNHGLGVPENEREMAGAHRDKFAMAEAVRRAGLAAPRSTVVTEVDEAVASFVEHGRLPVVVKPVQSSGTDNVRICETADQVGQACAAVLSSNDYFGAPNSAAIVQEYLTGSEYTVNTVSVDGVHKVSDVWSSHKMRGTEGAPVYSYQEPQSLTDPKIVGLMDYVKDVVSALGIREGAAHSEVMLTERGPVLIETGARHMGTSLPDLSYELAGVSHIHLLAKALCDVPAFHRYSERSVSWSRKLRYVWMVNRAAGEAGAGIWREKYRKLPTFRSMIEIEQTGLIPRTVDLRTSLGFVALVADSTAALDRDHNTIRTLEQEGIYLL
ncbi:ATP-grasp domain-containing protein [Streptomyces anulatus]